MRVFLIGAAGGIGSALARRLHADGHEVILAGRTEASLASLGAELSAEHIVVDATGFDALDQAVQRFGPVNAVVNCAGSLLLKPAHLTTQEEWRATIELSLTTAFATVRAAKRFSNCACAR